MLTQSFFQRSALEVAPELLGMELVHVTPRGRVAGIIVETEAYLQEDEASHTFNGINLRNATMFGPAGHWYAYRSYGMHTCLNAVTGKEGEGSGVLLRALEPTAGIEIMKEHRNTNTLKELCNGPGKLTQALGISLSYNGHSLSELSLFIRKPINFAPPSFVITTRVGITKATHLPYRFYIKDNTFISKK